MDALGKANSDTLYEHGIGHPQKAAPCEKAPDLTPSVWHERLLRRSHGPPRPCQNLLLLIYLFAYANLYSSVHAVLELTGFYKLSLFAEWCAGLHIYLLV
jgi:hypothetical protein